MPYLSILGTNSIVTMMLQGCYHLQVATNVWTLRSRFSRNEGPRSLCFPTNLRNTNISSGTTGWFLVIGVIGVPTMGQFIISDKPGRSIAPYFICIYIYIYYIYYIYIYTTYLYISLYIYIYVILYIWHIFNYIYIYHQSTGINCSLLSFLVVSAPRNTWDAWWNHHPWR